MRGFMFPKFLKLNKNVRMRRILLALMVTFFPVEMWAQQTVTLEVKSGPLVLEKSLPENMVFLFPEFRQAEIFFSNGSKADKELNYNMINGNLLFKDRGIVFEFAFPETVDSVLVGDIVLVGLQEGFGKRISSYGDIVIVSRRYTDCTDFRKMGAFGVASGTSSSTSYSSMGGNSGTKELTVPGEYDFELKEVFLILHEGKEYVFSIKNMKKLIPERKNDIDRISKGMKPKVWDEENIRVFMDELS